MAVVPLDKPNLDHEKAKPTQLLYQVCILLAIKTARVIISHKDQGSTH